MDNKLDQIEVPLSQRSVKKNNNNVFYLFILFLIHIGA